MTRKVKPTASKKRVAPPVEEAMDADTDTDDALESSEDQIADRPDGFYWRTVDGRQEFGPFDTIELARADMEASDVSVEALQEAESEIGVADWIDPETGEPAEGLSTPRLAED